MEATSFADPLLFFLNDTSEYSMYYRGFTTTAPASFSLGKLFVWLAVLGGLTLLACLCVIKRKAEQAGISGRCHTMTYILVTVTEFCSFTLVYTSFDTSSRLLAFCMAALSGILVYGIWNTAFLHTSGGRIKVLVKAFLQIAAGAFVFIVIAAGGSIVKGILPSTEKVTEAAVVYVGNPSYICGETSGSSTGNSYYMVSNFTFSERADIDRVLKLHTELKQMGMLKKESSETDFSATVVPYDIQISYTMSDGSVKTWYYDRASLAILEQMLEEEESDDMQEAMRTVITGGDTGDTTNRAAKAYASGDIYLSNTWYTKPYRISLSDDLRNELRNALADDIIDQTVSERYFPGEDAIGVILFSANGESDIKSFSWNLGNALIYVTKDYTNTIAFLKKHDIISCFDFDGEIESITLQKYDPYGGINGRKKPLSNFFIGYKSDSIDDFIVQVDFGAKQPITDETRLAKLIPRLRSTYNMTEEGYLAAVKLKGSNQYIYKYLPGTVSLTQ